jgi:uncharacterized protein
VALGKKLVKRSKGWKPSSSTRREIAPGASRFHLQVRRSTIHRFGVFAGEGIPARRQVIEYTGRRVALKQVQEHDKRHWKPEQQEPTYLFLLNKRWLIDGAVGGSGAELVNHCCDPNLAVRRLKGKLLYFSRRRIQPGEELTLDYRFSSSAEEIPCKCGSRKCRGTINGKPKR